jgi:hypothetical protein
VAQRVAHGEALARVELRMAITDGSVWLYTVTDGHRGACSSRAPYDGMTVSYSLAAARRDPSVETPSATHSKRSSVLRSPLGGEESAGNLRPSCWCRVLGSQERAARVALRPQEPPARVTARRSHCSSPTRARRET